MLERQKKLYFYQECILKSVPSAATLAYSDIFSKFYSVYGRISVHFYPDFFMVI